MKTKPMRDAQMEAAALRLVKRFKRFCSGFQTPLGKRLMLPRRRARDSEASKSRAFESALAGIGMDHDEAVSVLRAQSPRFSHGVSERET
jgi:hypothetical protein